MDTLLPTKANRIFSRDGNPVRKWQGAAALQGEIASEVVLSVQGSCQGNDRDFGTSIGRERAFGALLMGEPLSGELLSVRFSGEALDIESQWKRNLETGSPRNLFRYIFRHFRGNPLGEGTLMSWQTTVRPLEFTQGQTFEKEWILSKTGSLSTSRATRGRRKSGIKAATFWRI